MQTESAKVSKRLSRACYQECSCHLYNTIKETSQLTGKGCKDSDYTIMIAIVQ